MTKVLRIETDTRRSRVVIYNGVVYVGGMTADDKSDDITGQTKQVLAKIDGFLARAGTGKQNLLTAQIWLKDIEKDFEKMNKVWNLWTAPGAAPTRATAQCQMASSGTLIEIIVTAAVAD